MYWVSLEPSDTDKELLKSLRDARYADVDSRVYDTEPNPHLTIVPGFSVPDGTTPTKEEIQADLPITVEFSEYHIWPSIDNPMVVALDPSSTTALTDLQETTLVYVDALEGDIEYEPTPFHLTLFKGGDAGEEESFTVGEASKRAIQSFVDTDESLPITIEFDTLSVAKWKI